ncbi:hypothetical protein MMC11_005587 [Xylographa trunciseda]|nr:hypothetical protein [Xylographa trunciseda]
MTLQPGPTAKVDRQTTTPFHLKLFYRTGGFHRLEEFPTSPASPLPSHLQIYTWPTCTLRELSHLLTSALPTLLPDPSIGTRLSYRLIFPDTREISRQGPGRYLSKELGSVVVGGDGPGIIPEEVDGTGDGGGTDGAATGAGAVAREGLMAGKLAGDPEKTLQEARFVIGDYVDCAILAPLADGSVNPGVGPAAGVAGRGSGYGGARGSMMGGPRENGFGGFRGGGRGAPRGGFGAGRLGDGGVPTGEWRRGERVPEGSGRGFGRGRGRGGY